MRVRFGDCIADSEARELTRAGRRVDISPRAFSLLCALLERHPKVVSKGALHDLLWAKTFVGATSLARLVTELRKAIGDDPQGARFIRTVRGFGYAFCGEVGEAPRRSVAASESPLVGYLVWDARQFPLAAGDNILGRADGLAPTIPSTKVSRRHARLRVEGGRATLEDLGSKNGTFLNGERLVGPATLADGDEIEIGPARLIFRAWNPSGSTETARR